MSRCEFICSFWIFTISFLLKSKESARVKRCLERVVVAAKRRHFDPSVKADFHGDSLVFGENLTAIFIYLQFLLNA